MSLTFIKKVWGFCKAWRTDLKAAAAKYFVTREVVKVLALTHAQELLDTPRNEWSLVRQKQVAEIQAVRSGQTFDIVDRRSWPYAYLPEALHRLNQPVLKNCFSADTEILTKRGWISITQVRKGDFVASRMLDGTATWVPVKKLFKYHYKGKMVSFTGKYVDLLVSPDHKMYGRFRASSNVWGDKDLVCSRCGKEFTTPQALGSHRKKIHEISGSWREARKQSYSYSDVHYPYAKDVEKWVKKQHSGVSAFEIPVKTEWEGEFPESYDSETGTVEVGRYVSAGKGNHWKSEKVRVNLKDLVAFFGLYAAEGSVRGSYSGMDLSATSKKPHYVQAMYAAADTAVFRGWGVRIAQTPNSANFDKIKELLDRLPWRFNWDGTSNFEAFDENLFKLVKRLGNTYTKYIPKWIKRLPPKYLKVYLRWHRRGDGMLTSEGVETHFTVSKRLADDLQEIIQISGNEAGLRKIKQRGSEAWGLDASRQAPLYQVTKHRFAFKGIHSTNTGEVEYDGYIYCPAIPPYETVYVRRNGKASWCGRTPYNL